MTACLSLHTLTAPPCLFHIFTCLCMYFKGNVLVTTSPHPPPQGRSTIQAPSCSLMPRGCHSLRLERPHQHFA